MSSIRAEVISIGDELTSGSLLDTNTQWISQQLRASGIDVAFHTTVGDDLADNIAVFLAATRRADLIISTGGLGPTADDLTRNAIAEMAQVKLVKDDQRLNKWRWKMALVLESRSVRSIEGKRRLTQESRTTKWQSLAPEPAISRRSNLLGIPATGK